MLLKKNMHYIYIYIYIYILLFYFFTLLWLFWKNALTKNKKWALWSKKVPDPCNRAFGQQLRMCSSDRFTLQREQEGYLPCPRAGGSLVLVRHHKQLGLRISCAAALLARYQTVWASVPLHLPISSMPFVASCLPPCLCKFPPLSP